ncbi:hypothetical protein [Pseudomonas sp. PAMC 25886]|uniref:hypothetical protein n=1 Tax=Pseudomonas sp. PAMC 25886 TaxID=1125977 RepID=UPI001146B4FD|nr:hypothetical protein [Pseudomonas sp. PAMC 25886]
MLAQLNGQRSPNANALRPLSISKKRTSIGPHRSRFMQDQNIVGVMGDKFHVTADEYLDGPALALLFNKPGWPTIQQKTSAAWWAYTTVNPWY